LRIIGNCIQYSHSGIEFIVVEDILGDPDIAPWLESQSERGVPVIKFDSQMQKKNYEAFPI